MRVRIGSALLLVSLLLIGCQVTPKVPLDVSRAFARDGARVLRTEHIDLYYPRHLGEQARAFAERLEGCLVILRARTPVRGGINGRRLQVLFPDLPFNNAFVHPPFNGDFFALVPTYMSFEITAESGLLPAPDYVGCHELVHYVQSQQTFRFWGAVDRAFGSLMTQQVGLESWFAEGIATYYEQALQPGTGRPAWPAWEGFFHAAVANRRVRGGDLNVLNRDFHWGNHYLFGSYFVAYLVETYGEQRLWQLIQRQGQSFFFPFIVNSRFKRVYGRSLSQLIDDFGDYVARKYPARARPSGQRVLRSIGNDGRYARAPNGTEAFVQQALDAPATLTVRNADGELRYQTRLIDVLPSRKLVMGDVRNVSGLRFSRDGRFLYFVAVDQGWVFQEARLLRLDLASHTLRVVRDDLAGLGGDVSPDGREYVFVRVSAQGHVLTALDLQTGNERVLYRAARGEYLFGPTFAPDGARIVATSFASAYSLAVFDARTGARLDTLFAPYTPVYDPSFVEDGRILFTGAHEGRFQIFVYDPETQRTQRLTAAPYLAHHARAAGNTVRFFNRDGLHYTLDEVRLPPRAGAAAAALQTASETRLLSRSAPTFLAALYEPPTEQGPSVPATTDAPAQPAAPEDGTPSAVPVPEVDAQAAPNPAADQATAPLVTDSPQPPLDAAPAQPPAPPPAVPEGPASSTPVAPAQTPIDQELSLRSGAPWPLPSPPALTLQNPTDEPYRAWPDVVIPTVRTPMLGGSSGAGDPLLGFYLGGSDPLGQHRWGLSGAVQLNSWQLSGNAAYLNTQLSPVLLGAAVSQLAFEEHIERTQVDGTEVKRDERQRQRDAAVQALAVLRTTVLGLSAHLTSDERPDHPDVRLHERTLGGGTLSISHYAIEATPYSGARRGFTVSASASGYPKTWGTLGSDLTDVGGKLTLYSPLPFSKRHTLSLGLRGRTLFHGAGAPLLKVGGVNPFGLTLWDDPNAESLDYEVNLPPSLRFQEPLRGFETSPFDVDRIAIADLRYLYPIIFDAGTATSLYILPSFILRQIDLELFASGATDTTEHIDRRGHLAVGAALTIETALFGAGIALRYQFSRRLSDDEGYQHLISLGAALDE